MFVVVIRVITTRPPVRVNLDEAGHTVLPEVPSRLAHRFGTHRKESRIEFCIREGDRCDYAGVT